MTEPGVVENDGEHVGTALRLGSRQVGPSSLVEPCDIVVLVDHGVP